MLAVLLIYGNLASALDRAANRSPQSGQPAKFFVIRRESLTEPPE
jgi:hypothetical protein